MKFRTKDIMSPPIVELMEEAKEIMNSSDFLSLGQGLSGHIPPSGVLSSFSESIHHPSIHRYTPDQGLLELREELSLYLRKISGFDANPNTELAITAGANQGFAGAVLTLLTPGENMIMPTPYYFNSVMAVELAAGSVKYVPVADDFQPDLEKIASSIDEKTKAILMISPNNPTGVVYNQKTVDNIVDICLENDIMLISDETYARLVFENTRHYSPRSRRDATEHVVSLGSFSKDLGLSGWRIGYIAGPETFLEEFLKVQDTVTICASTPGQFLLLDLLKSGDDYIVQEMERLALLRELAYVRIRDIPELEVYRTRGTFYLFPRVSGCEDSRKLALDILKETETLVLPGSVFGEAGEGYIRMSIGPLTSEAVDEAFDRLESYFSTH